MNKDELNAYQVLGLVKTWEVARISEWRGWEIVGTNREENELFIQFLPDAAINALLTEMEKHKPKK